MKKRLSEILFHPAFLGLILLAVIILLLPPIFNKYQAKIMTTKFEHEPGVYSFFDLDADGYSEEVYYHGTLAGYPSLIVHSHGKIVDQWNLKGEYLGQDFFTYCDYNDDGTTEIFVFTVFHDSVFVSGIDPFAVEKPLIYKKFIDVCISYTGKYASDMIHVNTTDIDKNDTKELVFAISSGIIRQPRNMYILDIFNDTVIKSPESGTIIDNPVAFDINNDGFNEYLGRMPAYGNIHNDSIDYPDSCAYLMVLIKI